jgi:hypothetical protein
MKRWRHGSGRCSFTVCSGIGTPQQFCVPCRGSYTFDLIIYNDLLAGDETISITANEIPSTYAVLLGRKTTKQNNISLKCFRAFSNLYSTSPKSQLCSASFSAPAAVAKPHFRSGEETEPASGWPKERFLTLEPDEDFVDPADEYKMPWEEDNMPFLEGVSSKLGNASSYAASIGLEISGSEEFVTDTCALVLEFRDIFSTELSTEPADLPPLDVPIDTAKRHQPKNQGRPRNQSVEGQQEIKRHLEELLECGAISPVLHASAYSQILLVSKPDTKKEKRLVLDYRALNKYVGHMNWPLPNISHMIERIGTLKPKKFAKFDVIGSWDCRKARNYFALDLLAVVEASFCFLCSFLHRFPLPFSYFLCRYGGIFCLLRRHFRLSMEHNILWGSFNSTTVVVIVNPSLIWYCRIFAY